MARISSKIVLASRASYFMLYFDRAHYRVHVLYDIMKDILVNWYISYWREYKSDNRRTQAVCMCMYYLGVAPWGRIYLYEVYIYKPNGVDAQVSEPTVTNHSERDKQARADYPRESSRTSTGQPFYYCRTFITLFSTSLWYCRTCPTLFSTIVCGTVELVQLYFSTIVCGTAELIPLYFQAGLSSNIGYCRTDPILFSSSLSSNLGWKLVCPQIGEGVSWSSILGLGSVCPHIGGGVSLSSNQGWG